MTTRNVNKQAGPLWPGLAVLMLGAALVGCGIQPPARPQVESRAPSPAQPAIRLTSDGKLEVTGLDAAIVASAKKLKNDEWPAYFPLRVEQADTKAEKLPPVAGDYQVVSAGLVRFQPRFPLSPGTRYHAAFYPPLNAVIGVATTPLCSLSFQIPRPETAPTTVSMVYPSGDVLPENLLRIYVHFSAPMSRGEAYEHIQILNEAGMPIEAAFLELGEELWDQSGMRFTLLFDPGRIKRGLKPREELGPVLEKGKSYRLVINKGWIDANGKPLRETYRKSFQVGAPFEQVVDPKGWKVDAPTAGKASVLAVEFPIPMDHALLYRQLWVADTMGKRLTGSVQVKSGERQWQFTPAEPWRAGDYRLVADVRLEDPCGNNLRKAFEVDVFHPIQREIKMETVEIPFAVRD